MRKECQYSYHEYIIVLMLDSILEGLHYVYFPSCINSMLDDIQCEIDSILIECESFYGKDKK